MKLAIIGGGSWGTALAITLGRVHQIQLWIHDAELAKRMQDTQINDVYLPGYPLPSAVLPTSDLGEALHGVDLVVSVTPSAHCRAVHTAMRPYIRSNTPLVSAIKGLELGTMSRMSHVIQEALGFKPRLGVLSGPTFALEIARGDPAAAVIASDDADLAREMQEAFFSGSLRPYTNSDVAGVEYAGSLKNIIAIGAGLCEGLGLGSNTLAALITRGLAEITRLACELGGKRETLAGLAGMGDLVLTCTGALSRNRSLGIELAHGRRLGEIRKSTRMVAEGVNTTTAALELAKKHGIEMPITAQMQKVLFEGRPPREALRDLMERSLKGE